MNVNKIKSAIDYVLKIICEGMLCFMTVIAVYQVVTRYVFNSPSSYSEELLTYSFAWTGMLAATLVFGERDHMKLSFFSDKVKGKKAILLELLSEVLILIFATFVLTYGGIAIVNLTMEQITATLGIPMGYVYAIMPISGFIIIIYCILNICELCGKLKE